MFVFWFTNIMYFGHSLNSQINYVLFSFQVFVVMVPEDGKNT